MVDFGTVKAIDFHPQPDEPPTYARDIGFAILPARAELEIGFRPISYEGSLQLRAETDGILILKENVLHLSGIAPGPSRGAR